MTRSAGRANFLSEGKSNRSFMAGAMTILVAASCLCSTSSSQAQGDEFPKYKVKELERSAQAGSAQSAWLLGEYYQTAHYHDRFSILAGVSTPSQDKPNFSKASMWFHKAADAGYNNPLQEEHAGNAFITKKVVAEGTYWLERAATDGNADAAQTLSSLYGGKLSLDPTKSQYWSGRSDLLRLRWSTLRPVLVAAEEQRIEADAQRDKQIVYDRAVRHEERIAAWTDVAESLNESMNPTPVAPTIVIPSNSDSTSSSDTSSSSSTSHSAAGEQFGGDGIKVSDKAPPPPTPPQKTSTETGACGCTLGTPGCTKTLPPGYACRAR